MNRRRMPDTTDLRVAACNFRESARSVRPHPANPHVVRAGDVAHFVDTDCAVIAQRIDEAADALDAKDRTIAELREALKPFSLEPEDFEDPVVDETGWTDFGLSWCKERICDWFGPSDFRRARTALKGQTP